MLIKSFSLIQPKCKLGWNEDKLGLKAANTFNPMLLILQPNKITLLREITRPKPWAQLPNSIKNEPLVCCHKAEARTSSQGPRGPAYHLEGGGGHSTTGMSVEFPKMFMTYISEVYIIRFDHKSI